jgi:hypothetical protein
MSEILLKSWKFIALNVNGNQMHTLYGGVLVDVSGILLIHKESAPNASMYGMILNVLLVLNGQNTMTGIMIFLL